MTWRYCALVCFGVLAACATPAQREVDDINQLARRGELEAADARYGSFLTRTSLEDEAWREVVEQRCAIREQIVTARRQALATTGPTRAELLELLRYSQLCAAYTSQDEALFAQMVAQTEADIEREIQPLYDQKAYGAMLARAPDFMPYLPATHRYATWFVQVRQAMAKSWRAQSEQALAQGRQMSSFYLTVLADDAEKTVALPTPPAEVVAKMNELSERVATAALRYDLVELDVISGANPCSARLIPKHLMDVNAITQPHILAVRARLEWTSCQIDITSTPRATGGVNTVFTLEGQTQLTSRLEGVEQSSSNTLPITIVVTRRFDSEPAREQALDVFFAPTSIGVSEVDTMLVRQVVSAVQKLEHTPAQVGASFRAMSTQVDDPVLALEHVLGAFFTTHRVNEDEARAIIAAFGIDPRPFPSASLVPAFSWYDPNLAERMPRNTLTRDEAAAALDKGIPTRGAVFALEFGLPEQDLVGQPDRSALGVSIATPMRWSLLKGSGKGRGLGLVLGTNLGVHIGKRFGGDYQDVSSPPELPPYEPDEEFGSFGFHADALAMLGRRGQRLGLFVGARPGFMHRSFGFYKTQGSRLPLAARLEWRGERGVVLEGWWGDFSSRHDNSSMGALLIIQGPPSQGISSGLTLAAQQDVLPAHFFGLNQRDRVRLERATLTTASIGLWYGF